jgi:hypothetical protein
MENNALNYYYPSKEKMFMIRAKLGRHPDKAQMIIGSKYANFLDRANFQVMSGKK